MLLNQAIPTIFEGNCLIIQVYDCQSTRKRRGVLERQTLSRVHASSRRNRKAEPVSAGVPNQVQGTRKEGIRQTFLLNSNQRTHRKAERRGILQIRNPEAQGLYQETDCKFVPDSG